MNKKNRTIIVINDVCDENGRARQQARCHSVLGQIPIFVGVKNDIEASGEIIDQYANLKGAPGLIIAQSAPRTQETNQTNGTSFCYFWIEDTLFITSTKGKILSLVKKLSLVEEVKIINSEESLNLLGILSEKNSQFRSLEWLYKFAEHLLNVGDLPHLSQSINTFQDSGRSVWHVDKWKDHYLWGNCKTTITEDDIMDMPEVTLCGLIIKVFDNLKDIPEGELGIIRSGSSGIVGKKFIEISVGNGNASEKLGLHVGSEI